MEFTDIRIHPPLQARSRRTLERIMDATEELLETASFEHISIQQITAVAGVASGSFYTRFADKNTVLTALFARYLEDTESLTDELVASVGAEEPLASRVRSIVSFMVGVFRDRRGISRAAQLHYLRNPEETSVELRSRLGDMYERLAQALLCDGISHAEPRWAARFAIELATSSCRSKILFSDHPVPDATPATDVRFAEELSRAVLGYLSVRFPHTDEHGLQAKGARS